MHAWITISIEPIGEKITVQWRIEILQLGEKWPVLERAERQPSTLLRDRFVLGNLRLPRTHVIWHYMWRFMAHAVATRSEQSSPEILGMSKIIVLCTLVHFQCTRQTIGICMVTFPRRTTGREHSYTESGRRTTTVSPRTWIHWTVFPAPSGIQVLISFYNQMPNDSLTPLWSSGQDILAVNIKNYLGTCESWSDRINVILRRKTRVGYSISVYAVLNINLIKSERPWWAGTWCNANRKIGDRFLALG